MERQRRYPSDLTDGQWEIVEPMLPLIKSPGGSRSQIMIDAMVTVAW
jgi:transposase